MPSQKESRTAIPPQIIDEAADWLIAMREPEVSTEQRESFADWLRTSPLHVRAYLEIASLWNDSARVGAELCDGERVDEASNVVPIWNAEAAAVKDEVAKEAIRPPRRARRVAIAASALLACVAASTLVWWQASRPDQYVASIGEQRTFTLEDGSIVRLNSRSRLSVRLSEGRRDVDLLEGQAHFEVAKDPSRPFIVRSGSVTVRAVGTAFDVYRKPNDTVVTVVEGRVLVRSGSSAVAAALPEAGPGNNASGAASDPDAHVVALSAGEQAKVNSTGRIEHQPTANIAAATSWMQQELIFEGQPLSSVVEEFNRYSRRTVVVTDPDLAAFRINGVFHSTNPEALLRFLGKFNDVDIEQTQSEIRISRRTPAPE